METMLSPEDLAYQESCRRYAETELPEIEKKYGETNEVPDELRRSMANAGLFRHIIPKEYGGDGISAVRVCLAREVLAGAYGPADVTLAMQGLGSYPIVLGGTEEQKQRYLPKIVSGDYLATFALTEPNAGSDVSNLETVATPVAQGYALNGVKRFISNGANQIYFLNTKEAHFVLENEMNSFDDYSINNKHSNTWLLQY